MDYCKKVRRYNNEYLPFLKPLNVVRNISPKKKHSCNYIKWCIMTSKFLLLFCFLSLNLFNAQSQPLADSGIYERTMLHIRNCLQSTIEKDSIEKRNYCYQKVLVENYEELKKYGVDTLADVGFKKYYPLCLKRFQKPKESNKALSVKDDSFLGSYVSQSKLSAGSYTINLFSISENKSMVFISDKPLDENEIKLLPKNKDNIAIAYHTQRKNDKVVRLVKSVVYLR